MIYTFRIISGEDDQFIREVEIDSCCLFLDFHKFLNTEMKFDKGELASFFITDQNWGKETEITLLDMMEDQDANIHEMSTTKIGELITEKKQRLLYVFDLFAERILFLELTDIKDGEVSTPRCIQSEGEPPPPFKYDTFEGSDNYDANDVLFDSSEMEDPFRDEDTIYLEDEEDFY